MIVFDLEWTQPFGQDSMEEIIQIGAVKICLLYTSPSPRD